jgi:hypothetical protein
MRREQQEKKKKKDSTTERISQFAEDRDVNSILGF